jgi:molecular chaperone GrpE
MIQDVGGGSRADAEGESAAVDGQPETDEAEEAEEERVSDTEDLTSSKVGEEIELLRKQADENQDKFIRAAAELENFRKRAGREVENARRYGLERFAQALLPIRDSLEAGLASAEQADVEALLDGEKAMLRLLDSAFEQAGIEELDPQGEPFDPAKHEAMTLAPSETVEPNTVLTVVQKGYAIHDRLLRPARVIVAQDPGDEEG